MIHDYVIIGGGVAGLSAAIHLAELGAKPLLIEAGNYPAHKICGEFLSPEVLPILKRWNINPSVMLDTVTFHTNYKNSPESSLEFSFKLPKCAGSMSRYNFDAHLAQYAQTLGVIILTNTSVTDIYKSNTYHVMLSSGQEIIAQTIIIGTGRVLELLQELDNKKSKPKYFGLKMHLQNNVINLENTVNFYSFSGAYLGISSVGNNTINLACLATIETVKKFATPDLFMRHLAEKSHDKILQELIVHSTQLFPEWMTCYAPEFGIKNTPDMPNVYLIGDAAGTIPPASGDGLGIAITSGELLARYATAHDAKGFKKAWVARYKNIIGMGKLLHIIMMRPWLAKIVIRVCSIVPGIAKKLFLKTRTGF